MRPLRDERGTASIEFIVAGVVLLVPMVYLAISLSAAQGASLACAGAARQAARVAAEASTAQIGQMDAERAVRVAFSDVGLTPGPGALELERTAEAVTATVRADVVLPFVPAVFGLDRAARIPIEATATIPVSRFAASAGGP